MLQVLDVPDAGVGENWDANRPADIMLDSPDRVDKLPKRWAVAPEAFRGTPAGRSTAAGRCRPGPAEDAAVVQLQEDGCAAVARGRPDRKRKVAGGG